MRSYRVAHQVSTQRKHTDTGGTNGGQHGGWMTRRDRWLAVHRIISCDVPCLSVPQVLHLLAASSGGSSHSWMHKWDRMRSCQFMRVSTRLLQICACERHVARHDASLSCERAALSMFICIMLHVDMSCASVFCSSASHIRSRWSSCWAWHG